MTHSLVGFVQTPLEFARLFITGRKLRAVVTSEGLPLLAFACYVSPDRLFATTRGCHSAPSLSAVLMSKSNLLTYYNYIICVFCKCCKSNSLSAGFGDLPKWRNFTEGEKNFHSPLDKGFSKTEVSMNFDLKKFVMGFIPVDGEHLGKILNIVIWVVIGGLVLWSVFIKPTHEQVQQIDQRLNLGRATVGELHIENPKQESPPRSRFSLFVIRIFARE